MAQITNGVFDPSKATSRDLAEELKQIEVNILSANEFNQTIGTPDHPRAVSAAPAVSGAVVPPAPVVTYQVHQSGPPPKKLPRSVVDPNYDSVPSFTQPLSGNGPLNFVARALSPRSRGQSDSPINFEDVEFTAPVLETAEINDSGQVVLELDSNSDLPQSESRSRSNSPLNFIGRALAPGPHGSLSYNENAIPAFNFILKALAPGPQGSLGRGASGDGEVDFSQSSVPVFEPSEIGNSTPIQSRTRFGNNDPLENLFKAFAPRPQGSLDGSGRNGPFYQILQAFAPVPHRSASGSSFSAVPVLEPVPIGEAYAPNSAVNEGRPLSTAIGTLAPAPPVNQEFESNRVHSPKPPTNNENGNSARNLIMRALSPGPQGKIEDSSSAIQSVPSFEQPPFNLPQ